ncbi:hypothetical protein CCAND93_510017 [Capnocytophaga canis]|uniref:Uncharacterized protein n=1 Tax=Capnocytophaga canis TaxID=1848903 RepID=A0A0B7IP61_9FLAO|nr:hypothetical protein CCAND93_510017 [Capnocytophaga canis]
MLVFKSVVRLIKALKNFVNFFSILKNGKEFDKVSISIKYCFFLHNLLRIKELICILLPK